MVRRFSTRVFAFGLPFGLGLAVALAILLATRNSRDEFSVSRIRTCFGARSAVAYVAPPVCGIAVHLSDEAVRALGVKAELTCEDSRGKVLIKTRLDGTDTELRTYEAGALVGCSVRGQGSKLIAEVG